MHATSDIAARTDQVARRAAFAVLTEAARHTPLSFPKMSAVIREHNLPRAETPLLLRELLEAGVQLPAALDGAAAPATQHDHDSAAERSPIPPARYSLVRVLRGNETLDISAISLADLGLEASSAQPAPRPRSSTPATADRPQQWVDEEPEKRTPPPALDPVKLYLKDVARYSLLTAEEEVELAKQIEAGVFAQERLTRGGLPQQLRRDLRHLARKGQRAFGTFVAANLRLVVSIARHYTGRGLDLPDLIQEGNLGLLRAVQKFDFTRGGKFSTYATWWIQQVIMRALAGQARTIRYPAHIVEKLNQVHGAVRRLQNSGASINTTAIAEASDVPETEVRRLLTELPVSRSLEELLETLGEEHLADMADRYLTNRVPDLRGFHIDDIEQALKWCTERELRVLERRFGFFGEPATLEVIGSEFGVTRERIRQIESKAIKNVRLALQ